MVPTSPPGVYTTLYCRRSPPGSAAVMWDSTIHAIVSSLGTRSESLLQKTQRAPISSARDDPGRYIHLLTKLHAAIDAVQCSIAASNLVAISHDLHSISLSNAYIRPITARLKPTADRQKHGTRHSSTGGARTDSGKKWRGHKPVLDTSSRTRAHTCQAAWTRTNVNCDRTDAPHVGRRASHAHPSSLQLHCHGHRGHRLVSVASPAIERGMASQYEVVRAIYANARCR